MECGPDLCQLSLVSFSEFGYNFFELLECNAKWFLEVLCITVQYYYLIPCIFH